jgi:hypothetical protein
VALIGGEVKKRGKEVILSARRSGPALNWQSSKPLFPAYFRPYSGFISGHCLNEALALYLDEALTCRLDIAPVRP